MAVLSSSTTISNTTTPMSASRFQARLPDHKGERHRERQEHELLPERSLAPGGKLETVPGVDGGA